MIELFFEAGKITVFGQEYNCQNLQIADEFTLDAELETGENIWTTSFNVQSVTVNGQIFQSSQELLKFFQH